jgi:hypothetical protein
MKSNSPAKRNNLFKSINSANSEEGINDAPSTPFKKQSDINRNSKMSQIERAYGRSNKT